MRIVLDASAALRLVMRTDEAADILDVLDRAALVLAPSLFHAEVANALGKYVRAGQVTSELALARYQEATGLIDGCSDDAEMITEALTETHGGTTRSMTCFTWCWHGATAAGCSLVTNDRSR